MAVVRVRQHVNPLSHKYQTPVELPDWASIYVGLHRPLHIDIGSGKGQFLLQMAAQHPNWNFLGLDIRQPVVDYALRQRNRVGHDNLHFVFCNVNVSLRSLLESWPQNFLQQVSIQFPDPWFKKRHQKRRVLQPELVSILAAWLPPGGGVVIQSDVEEVAEAMSDRLAENPAFRRTDSHWLAVSPFTAQTERERVTLGKGQPVYRAQFLRQSDSDQPK